MFDVTWSTLAEQLRQECPLTCADTRMVLGGLFDTSTVVWSQSYGGSIEPGDLAEYAELRPSFIPINPDLSYFRGFSAIGLAGDRISGRSRWCAGALAIGRSAGGLAGDRADDRAGGRSDWRTAGRRAGRRASWLGWVRGSAGRLSQRSHRDGGWAGCT